MNEDLQNKIKRETIKLEDAYNKGNCMKMIQIMNFLFRYSHPENEFIFPCIYVLIKNNYLSEAQHFLCQLEITEQEEKIVAILQNAIRNQENYQSLTDEQKNVYEAAILYGHSYFELDDFITAYDVYSWGYYLTEQPIFLYYMGKMLYKCKRYRYAKPYFLEYLEKGDSKVSKAYVYLCFIERKHRHSHLAKQYALFMLETDKIYNTGYEFEDDFVSRVRKK